MNRLPIRLLLRTGLILLAPSAASAQVPLPWVQVQSRDRLSEARELVSAATVGGQVLFAGGNGYGSYTDVVDIYDADTKKWSTTALSVARLGHAGAAVGHLALFAGGEAAPGSVVDVVDIYDGSSGAWSADKLSAPRLLPAAASHGLLAFFAGGSPTWPPTSSDVVDVYDADKNTWSTRTLSAPRAFLAAASAGQKVLFAGGVDYAAGVVHDTVDVYDVPTGTWSSSAPLSLPRYLLVATAVGSKVLFAGGLDANDVASDVVDIYDSTTGNWSTGTLSQARAWFAATTVGDKAMFGGGYSAFGGPGNLFDTVDVYDASDDTWSQDALSESRARLSAATVRGQALFAGGAVPGAYSYVVDIFDFEVGSRYCGPAVPNSAGASGGIRAIGSAVAADNDLVLTATELPPEKFGYFLVSETQGFLANPGGSQGNLCLAGSIGRYIRPGELRSSGAAGTFSLVLDLADTPQPSGPITILAGETWNFTAWYRDVNPSQTSNFTDAVSVAFE